MNLLKITTRNDGQIIRSLLNYPSENEALSAMYYELWYATSDENTRSIMVELISDDGRVVKCERFSRPAEITEPEFFDDKEEL